MSVIALFGGLALLLWSIPPGLAAAGFCKREERLWSEDAAAVAIAAGFGVLAVGSSFLAKFGWLSAMSFWVVGGTVATISLGLVIFRRRHRPAQGSKLLIMVVKVVGPLILALVAFAPHLATIVLRPDALPGSTPWYYWDLTTQTVASHGFPETSIEWDTEVPFLADYPAFTAMTAGAALASTAPDLVFAAHLLRIASAIGAGFGLWYLSRVWGASKHGAAASVFLLASLVIYAAKLSSYRPEAAGYMLMFIVPALAKRWFDTRQHVFLFVSALGLAALGLTHGVTWTVGAILTIATALSYVLIGTGRRSQALRAGILILLAFGLWAATSLAIQGRITEAGKLTTAPELTQSGVDPTWEFAALVRGESGSQPPTSGDLASRLIDQGFTSLPVWIFWTTALAGVVMLLFTALRGNVDARRLLVMLCLMAIGVTMVALFFSLGWSTYVPRRTGFSRIFQISVVVVPLAIGVAAGSTRFLRGPGVSTVFVASAVAIWAFGAAEITDSAMHQLSDRSSLAQQRSLELSGTALLNDYSEGYLAANLGLHGVLEGRAPYTNAELLDTANARLIEARDFFADPRNSEFDSTDYDFVIATTQPWAMGTGQPFPVDIAGLRSRPDLRVVAENPVWIVMERIDQS